MKVSRGEDEEIIPLHQKQNKTPLVNLSIRLFIYIIRRDL